MERVTYTVQEVAELLGISKSHAYGLVKERRLPILDIGRRKVIPKAALDTWIQENTIK